MSTSVQPSPPSTRSRAYLRASAVRFWCQAGSSMRGVMAPSSVNLLPPARKLLILSSQRGKSTRGWMRLRLIRDSRQSRGESRFFRGGDAAEATHAHRLQRNAAPRWEAP